MALKTFEVRCWEQPRGQYLIAANSKAEASRLLGCSVYHLTQYASILDSDHPLAAIALAQPKAIFKRYHYTEKYKLFKAKELS